MDFHGNNVHHVGHAHRRLIAAIRQQLNELPFTEPVRAIPCLPPPGFWQEVRAACDAARS